MTNEEARTLWAAGDWRALAPVLQRIAAGSVFVFARRWREPRDMMDDLVQQTLVQCWQYPEAPVYPFRFVRAAAMNLARDVYKSRAFRTQQDAPAQVLQLPDAQPSPLDMVIQQDAQLAWLRAIDRLPPMYRAAMIEQLSAGPDFVSISSTTRMRLCRARKLLQDVRRTFLFPDEQPL